MNANDIQVGGTHYKSGIQHWDFCAANFGPGYFRGNATKYLARWRKKNGLEDLKKARHYVQKMREVDWEALGWSLAGACSRRSSSSVQVDSFRIENGIPLRDSEIIARITHAAGTIDLDRAMESIDVLIAEAEKESSLLK